MPGKYLFDKRILSWYHLSIEDRQIKFYFFKGDCMKNEKCEVEVFSRVTGFFRPVQSWNNGKREEFKDRERFVVEEKKK